MLNMPLPYTRLTRTNRSHRVGLQHNHVLDIQPDVTVSRHPAPTGRPFGDETSHQWAKSRGSR
jgi:hypothetical protein